MPNKQIFGYPDQWEDFEKRNAKFIERFPTLKRALDMAFVREFTTNTPADRAIYFLGRLCIEDFMELLCLAANGYGVGALKLLRGLYERVVTAAYLSKNPEEADLFLDFRFISRHKALQAYIAGGTPDKRWLDLAEKKKDDFERVKARFEVDDCKKCGTTESRIIGRHDGSKKEPRVVQERKRQHGLAHSIHATAHAVFGLAKSGNTAVGQFLTFDVAP